MANEVTYKLGAGKEPKTRYREGAMPCDPAIVLAVIKQLGKGGESFTLDHLINRTVSEDAVSANADDKAFREFIDGLVNKWHAKSYLTGKNADGTPAKARNVRSLTGGTGKPASRMSTLGKDEEARNVPAGAVVSWLNDAGATIRETLSQACKIIVRVVPPSAIIAHLFVLLGKAQSEIMGADVSKMNVAAARKHALDQANILSAMNGAGILMRLTTGSHETHRANADTMQFIRAFENMEDEDAIKALVDMDLDAMSEKQPDPEPETDDDDDDDGE